MNVCDLQALESDTTPLSAEARALFHNDAVGVLVMRGGIVERCNARLGRMFGCAPDELTGQHLGHFPSRPAPGTQVIETSIIRKDATAVMVRATASESREAPDPGLVVWIVEDLTEREQARNAQRCARRRAQKLGLVLDRALERLGQRLPTRKPLAQDLLLQDQLLGAVQRQEFELHYQPIYDLRSMQVCSVEALVRWRGPDGEWIPPSRFVPLAEASGLIQPLGRWILGEACRQAHEWRHAGLPAVPISVNLSPRQLAEPDLAQSILDTLQATGVEPPSIELEITETSLMQDIDGALPTLQRIAESGIRLAIDDFGAGYSSLSYLRQLPVRKIKIDQSFVRELHSDPNNIAIVSAIVALAKELGMTTVAEGVETDEQLRILRMLGCDCCQGYLLARPLPPQMLRPLLLSRTEELA